LAEGVAELIAELISGNVGNARHAAWTQGKEAEIETAFTRELGYWVGYHIAKTYYLRSGDRKAALKNLIELDDPKAFLVASGWTPGIPLPANDIAGD
jgi:uncharacterized protein YjaZ